MNPENFTPEAVTKESLIAPLKQVTPVSKYLALILFILLPFIGGYVGYVYAPEKVVEVERVDETATSFQMEEVADFDQWLQNQVLLDENSRDVSLSEKREELLSDVFSSFGSFRFYSREYGSLFTRVSFIPKNTRARDISTFTLTGTVKLSHYDMPGIWFPAFTPDEESEQQMPQFDISSGMSNPSAFYVENKEFLAVLCESVNCIDIASDGQPFTFNVALDIDELSYEVDDIGKHFSSTKITIKDFKILE